MAVAAVQARIRDAAMQILTRRGPGQVAVSELAQLSGVARGTIYNNGVNVETLFEDIAADLADDMHRRVMASFGDTDDPALRLAWGIRFFIRRAHDEPLWGRFIVRFAFSMAGLRGMETSQALVDLLHGIDLRRYDIRPEQTMSVLSMIYSTTVSAMFLVLEGHKTWRDAGSDAAELVLRALGIERDEARRLALADLPPLSGADT